MEIQTTGKGLSARGTPLDATEAVRQAQGEPYKGDVKVLGNGCNEEKDIGLGSNKRDHKVAITDIAISKVPLVKYREIPEEHYETLQEIARSVLELSREYNDCNETAITYSLDDPEGMIDDSGSLAVSFGDEHDVDPLNHTKAFHLVNSAAGCVIVILHNHPSLSKISLSDVSYLLKYMVLKMIVVVTNMGNINYIVNTHASHTWHHHK